MIGLMIAMTMFSGGERVSRVLDAAPIMWSEAEAAGVDPYLVAAIGWVETRWNPNIKSRTNDYGIMQINLKFSKIGKEQLRLLRPNIRYSIKIMKYWEKRFGKDWICHYNSGNRCYEKSRRYAKKVLRVMRALKKLGIGSV